MILMTNEPDKLPVYSEYRECFGKRKPRRHKDLYQKDMEESNGNVYGNHHQRADGSEEC